MNLHDKKLQIRSKFESCDSVLKCIIDIDNPIKSMIVSGAPGVGKTYNIMKELKKSHDSLLCNVTYMNGKSTTIGLVEALYNSRNYGDILVLDDIDSIFSSEDSLNILKAALDSSENRTITYASSSKILKDKRIPTTFEFNAKVIFITNINLKEKSNVHYSALISRSVYIDLEIHDNESIMIHMTDIMERNNIFNNELTKNESNEILKFIQKNVNELKVKLSLRLPIQISGIFKKYPYDWEKHCKNIFLN